MAKYIVILGSDLKPDLAGYDREERLEMLALWATRMHLKYEEFLTKNLARDPLLTWRAVAPTFAFMVVESHDPEAREWLGTFPGAYVEDDGGDCFTVGAPGASP